MMRRHRLVARLLLTVSIVGATTAHNHSILEDASAPRPASAILDARCALAEALSFHAVHRIVEREACWACHSHRGFSVAFGAALPEPVCQGRPLTVLPPGAVDNVARFTRCPRGPPPLLSL
jgi:hypothetical protein